MQTHAPADPNCLFCKLVSGKIPAHTLYEDEAVLCFLDIFPVVRGHALMIPKLHCPSLAETPPATLAAVAERLPKLSRAVMAGVGAAGCNVLTNIGPEAGQSVFHLHFHLLPRFDGDGWGLNWATRKLDPAEAAPLIAGIQNALTKG